MSQYFYTLKDRLGDLIVSPLGESDFSITWNRTRDDGRLSYNQEFGGTITFIKEAYKRLLLLEKTMYRCEYQEITIQRKCNPNKVWFIGRISLNSGEWDLDGCKVVLKFEADSELKCFDDNKDIEVDLFDLLPFREQVKMFPGDAIIEVEECSRVYNGNNGLEYYWCGDDDDPFDFGWTVFYHEQRFSGGVTEVFTHWARQKTTLPCAVTPSPDWILYSDDCDIDGTRTYVRPVNLYDCITRNNEDIGGSWDFYYFYECSVFGLGEGVTIFKNGLKVFDVLQEIINEFCPGKTLKSDFLTADINPVTGANSKTNNLFLFQKSDIKRPGSGTVATRAPWTFEGIIKTLVNAFNLRWDIIGDEFVIEHVSFFERDIGFNLNDDKYKKFVKGKKQYSYKQEDMPSIETWTWMEAKNSSDFKGLPITYSGGCVTNESKGIAEEFAMEDVTTDIELVISNPEPDSSVVEDDGFVLIATEKEPNGEYFIITENGILDDERINNSLGISQLLRDYHTYDRPYKVGNLNGQETDFETVRPTKLGATLSIPFCCDDDFNPKDYINTFFGLGIVDKATFNFKTSILSLDLLYNAYDGLLENNPPTVLNRTVRMLENTSEIIPVTEGWTDPDPDATILSVQVKNPPTSGTAFVRNDNTIRYTPNNNFTGNDNFTFTIKDNWGAESNVGLVSIEVYELPPLPVANDDFYGTSMDEILTVHPNGVFFNDTPQHGFSLLGYDQNTDLGGSVVLNSNGGFTYNPPVGVIGVDTFTYTIIDPWNNTSTATVHITIKDPNIPVGVNDYYLTTQNTSLQSEAGGMIPGLLDNDYTPSGSVPLTATAGVFSTNEGGSVTIDSDGSFLYVPPANFIGRDSFDYTVNNQSGSDTATAFIDIIEKVYVRMSDTNHKSGIIMENCDGVNTRVGSYRTKNIVLKFYKDSAGTVPFDISGLNFQIFAILQQKTASTGWIDTPVTFIATEGTSWLMEEDFEYRHEYNGCDGQAGILNESRYVLQNGGHYQVI